MKQKIILSLALFVAGIIGAQAQVIIGSQDPPHAGAVLELKSNSLGLLLPRVALLGESVWTLEGNDPVEGMMVFHTGTENMEKGTYVWIVNKWIKINEGDQNVCPTPDMPGEISFSGHTDALNLNETFTAKVSAVSGMTYQWSVPYGLELVAPTNGNQVTIKVVKAGSYPMNLISVTANNDCGSSSQPRTGSNSLTLEVNDCTDIPELTTASVSGNILVSGVKSGLGTTADPYVVNAGQVFTIVYTAVIPGEEYEWSLNNNGANHFTIEENNGNAIQLRAKDYISTNAADAIGLIAANECGSSGRISSQIRVRIEAVTFPTITGTTGGSNCGAGTVTLNATASSGSEVRWYDTVESTSLLHAGNSYTTPSLSESRYYYVEAYNIADNTTSTTRASIRAEINEIPTITKVKDVNRAGAGTVNLTGCATTSTSGANVRYFSAAAGGTALTSNTTAALAVGTHTFYAEAYTTSCTSERVAITVTVTPGTGIAISPNPNSITVPAEGTDTERTTVQFTVTNPDCLTSGSYKFEISGTGASIVNSNLTNGTFTVRFAVNTGAARTAVVTVTDPCGNTKSFTFAQAATSSVSVTKITLSPTTVIMNVINATQPLTYSILPDNATNKNVTWESSNTSVATVSNTGVVTAKGNGTAVITVTTDDGGKTATSTIKVDTDILTVIPDGGYLPNSGDNFVPLFDSSEQHISEGIFDYFTATGKPIALLAVTPFRKHVFETAEMYCSQLNGRLPNAAEAVVLMENYNIDDSWWTSTETERWGSNERTAYLLMSYFEKGQLASEEPGYNMGNTIVCIMD